MPVTTPCAHRGDAYRAAHGELETIVAANPTFVEALRLLAGAKQALGDPAAAAELLRRALALGPNWTPTQQLFCRRGIPQRLLGVSEQAQRSEEQTAELQ